MPPSQTTPRRPVADLGTLADVLTRLERDPALDEVRRREFCGAIRTICAVLGQPPAAVSAAMPDVERLLQSIPAGARGRSRKTIANTRSRLKAALLHCAAAPKPPPRGTPLTPEWRALTERLTEPRLSNGLSRLIRIASYRGIAPDQVTDAALEDVVRDVGRVNWGRDALPFWRRSVTLWNEAADKVTGWPPMRLTPPVVPRRREHLALTAFPISFQRELDAYLEWAAGSDPLAPDAPKTSLKPGTLRQRRLQLRLAASTLAKARGTPDGVTSLDVLVAPDNARRIYSAYWDPSKERQASAFVRGLAMTLLAVARHWVKAPEAQLNELVRMKRILGSGPSGLTAKNQRAIRQFDDPHVLRALLNLPEKLVEQVHTRRLSPARRLQKIQIAVAIGLLLVAPMRLQNLAGLRLDRQLQWPSGRNGSVFIALNADETKNAQALDYPIEGRTKDLLDEYLDRYRAHANAHQSPWLFVRIGGARMSDGALRDGITKAIKRELGIHLTPHQFRHLAAKVILDEHPGALGLVQGVLVHKNPKTTANFYAGMRTREATREYDKILERARSPKSAAS